MSNVLKYKGYIGSVEFEPDDMVFHGKLEGITDLVTFEGDNVQELVQAFKDSVDEYLELCKEVGKEPMKPFKGSFNVRVGKELHKKAFQVATTRHISLNQLVQEALEKEVKGFEHA
jgi:predicted HicB family RNase H-like nuclease